MFYLPLRGKVYLNLIMTLILTSLNTSGYAQALLIDKNAAQCNDIKCIRTHIDNIDDRILTLLAERTAYVRRAGIIKGPIQSANDNARVQDELAQINKKSIKLNVPVEISLKTFSSLIQASIQYEQQYKNKYFSVLANHH